jgi:hypothetical protein
MIDHHTRTEVLALLQVVSGGAGEERKKALYALFSLSTLEDNRVYMGSRELGLLSVLLHLASGDEGEL